MMATEEMAVAAKTHGKFVAAFLDQPDGSDQASLLFPLHQCPFRETSMSCVHSPASLDARLAKQEFLD